MKAKEINCPLCDSCLENDKWDNLVCIGCMNYAVQEHNSYFQRELLRLDGYEIFIKEHQTKIMGKSTGNYDSYNNHLMTLPYKVQVDKNISDTIKNLLILQ